MSSRVVVAFVLSLVATNAFAQDAGAPPTTESPAISNRLYARDTSTYDPTWALGRFGIFDRGTNTIIEFIEKPRMACDPATVLSSISAKQMPATQVYYFVADKSYSGSLSFFTASGSLSDKERQEISLTDIAVSILALNASSATRRSSKSPKLCRGRRARACFG